MTVEELLQRISSRELSEWIAFYSLEPFGEERADLRAGIVASVTANVFRSSRRAPFKPTDFMPGFVEGEPESADPPPSGGDEREQTWQRQLKIVEMLNAAFAGVDRRQGSTPSGRGGTAPSSQGCTTTE